MGIEFAYFQPYFGAENSFIYLLIAVLFLLAIFSFIKSEYDVLNPSFIYSICLTVFCILAALYTKTWDLPMHFNTSIIIIIMSLMFIGGGALADFCCNINKNATKQKSFVTKEFLINGPLCFFLTIILLYFLYLNYLDFVNIATQVTKETEFNKMLKPVIDGLNLQKIQLSRWNSYRLRFATGMAYLSILAIWINVMVRRYKEIMKWSVFVLLYFPFIILTGGRQQFMYLIIFSLISFFLVYRKSHNNKYSLKKEIFIIGIATIAFLFCFLGMGLVNGKIGADASFIKVLAHYAGTNISAFDVYINEMVMPDTPYIGTTTFAPIYNFLYKYGVNVPHFFQYITLFTVFGPVTTNVYTAFYRYIHDFGYFGCSMIMFLLGFVYTYIYKQIYHYDLKNWMILIYASIAYPIFLIGREERFFNEILSMWNVSFIVEILVLYKVFEFLNKWRLNNNEIKKYH